MSVEAIAWASKQRTGSPGAKLVLINRDSTSFDEGADLVIRQNIAQVLHETIPK